MVWTLLRLVAFAMTPVWVFSAAWALLCPSPLRRRVSTSVFGPVAAGLVRAGVVLPRDEDAPRPPDPFRTLAIQGRLGALTAELEQLSTDSSVYARGTKLTAATAAYDDVLADACTMAGLPLQRDGGAGRPVTRLMEESALRAAGWTW